MTDQQTYTDTTANTLITLHTVRDATFISSRSLHSDASGAPVMMPTMALLAMIDRADPDAMRAYLRETVERTYLENMGVPATERDTISESIASFKGENTEREIPEADSPEDVDERPDRDDPTERAQIDRSWALDRAADALGRLSAVGSPAGALPLLDVAGWIIDGTINLPEQILDTNMAGEVIS